MKKPDLSAIYAQLEPTVNANNMELYNLEMLTEYGNKILRVYIDNLDTTQPVTLDDCERINNAIMPVLDADDPIAGAYVLEVSSPGIERKLVKESHYQRYIGRLVELKLTKPISTKPTQPTQPTEQAAEPEKSKKFVGKLIGLDGGLITISTETAEIAIQRDIIAQCRLVYTERETL